MLNLRMLALERGIVLHPSCFPVDMFNINECSVISNLVRSQIDAYIHDRGLIDQQEHRILRVLNHYGTVIVLCIDMDMMNVIMQMNMLPANNRIFRTSDDGQARTWMAQRYSEGVFRRVAAVSTNDTTINNEEIVSNIQHLVPTTSPHLWHFAPRRMSNTSGGQASNAIFEFAVNSNNQHELERIANATNNFRRPIMHNVTGSRFTFRLANLRFDYHANLAQRDARLIIRLHPRAIRLLRGELNVQEATCSDVTVDDNEDQQQ